MAQEFWQRIHELGLKLKFIYVQNPKGPDEEYDSALKKNTVSEFR